MALSMGFVGGTGAEGRGLALRMALAGHRVVIGSRSEERARQAAQEVLALAPHTTVEWASNARAAADCAVVFLCVPYAAHRQTVAALAGPLAGKTVVDVVVPLEFRGGRPTAVPVPEGSAARQAQSLLPDSAVVAAFHTVSARDLLDPTRRVDTDVLVCGDEAEAKGLVMEAAQAIPGVRAVDGGPLDNSRFIEGFTVLLLEVNRRYRVRASLRLTGLRERA